MRRGCWIILSFMCWGCAPDMPDRDDLIDLMYEKRKAQLFASKDAECLERAVADAEAHVDSLIDQWINADLMDTLVFPDKPVKPEAPEHIIGTVQRFDKDSLK